MDFWKQEQKQKHSKTYNYQNDHDTEKRVRQYAFAKQYPLQVS